MRESGSDRESKWRANSEKKGSGLVTQMYGICSSLLLQLLLDSLGHLGEGILDVGGALGGGLQEDQIERGSELSSLVVLDLTLVNQVGLVTNQKLVDILAGVAVDLLQPLLDIVEGLLVGDIIDDDDTVSSTVVRRSDGTILAKHYTESKGSVSATSPKWISQQIHHLTGVPEALLTSSIPNLQLDGGSLNVDGTDFLQEQHKEDTWSASVSVCGGAERVERNDCDENCNVRSPHRW